MATAPTLAAYKAEVSAGDLSGIFEPTDPQFAELLNQAIINKHEELMRDCPGVYDGSATLTFASDAFEIDLPSDIDTSETHQVLLYLTEGRETETTLQNVNVYRRFGGILRFDSTQKAGQTYYIEYTKEPNEYDSSADLTSQTFSEGVSRRAKKYLAYELRRLYFDALRNNEPSSAGAKLRIDSNDIS